MKQQIKLLIELSKKPRNKAHPFHSVEVYHETTGYCCIVRFGFPVNAHVGFVTGAIVGAAIASENSSSQSGSTLLLNTDHDRYRVPIGTR